LTTYLLRNVDIHCNGVTVSLVSKISIFFSFCSEDCSGGLGRGRAIFSHLTTEVFNTLSLYSLKKKIPSTLKTAASSSETNKRENVRSHKFHKSTARISNRETEREREREREINSDSHFQKGEYSKDEKCRGKGLTNGRYIIRVPKCKQKATEH